MLDDQSKPVIHYVRQDDAMPNKMMKHTYRFFIINSTGIYNVSGAITAAFNVGVTDRSMTYSVNNLSPEDDLTSFTNAIKEFTKLPNLVLQDLILSARDTLEFSFSPEVAMYFPPVPLPMPEGRDQNSQDPVQLPS
jgi:hypothetical protein